MRMLHTSYQRFYVKGHFQYCTDAIDSKHIKVKHPSHWTPCTLITGCNRNKWHIYKTCLRYNGEENNASTIIAITSYAIFVSSHQTNVHINTYCNAMFIHCSRATGYGRNTRMELGGTWSVSCPIMCSVVSGVESAKKFHVERRNVTNFAWLLQCSVEAEGALVCTFRSVCILLIRRSTLFPAWPVILYSTNHCLPVYLGCCFEVSWNHVLYRPFRNEIKTVSLCCRQWWRPQLLQPLLDVLTDGTADCLPHLLLKPVVSASSCDRSLNGQIANSDVKSTYSLV
jgi:hypothetical protein